MFRSECFKLHSGCCFIAVSAFREAVVRDHYSKVLVSVALCSETSDNVLGAEFKVRHVNSNDGTVEGLDLLDKPAFTIQFHPEACPGPHDASPLFDRFQQMVADHLHSPEAKLVSKEGGS